MAKRKSPGRPGDVELSTNVYALQLKQQPIKVYRYDVKITGIKQRSGRVVEFTKKFKDELVFVNTILHNTSATRRGRHIGGLRSERRRGHSKFAYASHSHGS